MLATPALEERCKHIKDPVRRTIASVILGMDDAIGRVLTALREHHLDENTLIFFMNDNGGMPSLTHASNGALRGEKLQLYEGGIRVPLIVHWKHRVPAGKVYENPVMLPDVNVTALEVAGVSRPSDTPLDGVDLLPFINGEKTDAPHEILFWRQNGIMAVRKGDWKLIQPKAGPAQLFNLRNDIHESDDLARREPAKFDELAGAWEEWNRMMRSQQHRG